jgi:hypothetical protein
MMNASYQPGDQVFWWKRITSQFEYPYQAEVVAVGEERITILAEDPYGGARQVIRHVGAEWLQPVAVYHEKATNQAPAMLEPVASWGRFTRYLEIGADLRALRMVDLFENGNTLSYDRSHWVDDFGMLGDGQLNRNRKKWHWGQSEEITAAKFEGVWEVARRSATWQHQMATAKMARMTLRGYVPRWLTVTQRRLAGERRRRY